MNKQNLIKNIRQDLLNNVDKDYKKNSQSFFKEKIDNLGVRIPIVRKIAQKHYSEISKLDKKEVWSICEELLKNQDEFKFIAFDWVFRQKDNFSESDFFVFENWYKKYVNNWATCDDFCGHSLGYLIYKFPELSAKTKKWSFSKNRWFRRASAVVLIYSLRRNKLLSKAFEIADILLEDSEDLVQKAYGWMLKEATRQREKEIFQYVMRNKNKMPRTALRYAIEKMPDKLRKQAMTK